MRAGARRTLRFLTGPVLVALLALSLGGVWPFVAPAPAAAAPPMAGTAQVFPAANVWNRPVTDLPVHPLSATYLNTIGLGTSFHADFGSGTWNGGPIGIPYLVVSTTGPNAVPFVPIHYTAYGSESDPGPMPIPANAPIEGGANSGGDRHVIVIDQDQHVLYELYNAWPNGDGSWNADSGAKWSLDNNNLRPNGWTSADAAGLPIFAGLARYDEVASGSINHALRFTVPLTQKAHLWPARHDASYSTDPARPPMGLRLRLKASTNISGYSPQLRVILQCLKDYGMILADNGSAIFVSGAPDPRWDDAALHAINQIHGADLEVVDELGLMVDPNSAQVAQASGLPAPSPAPSPSPRPSASLSPLPRPSESPRPTTSPSPSSSPRPSESPRPSPSPSASPRPSPTPSASPSPRPSPSPSPSPAVCPLVGPSPSGATTPVLTVRRCGDGTVTPGSGAYPAGGRVTLTAAPRAGWVFAGWRVDDRVAGYNATLVVTMNASHSVVARFSKAATYTDLPSSAVQAQAVQQLGAADVIHGYGDGTFGPDDPTLRAQMAALIARAMGWDAEDHGTGFGDREDVDADLWRNVGTLAYYGVARGYGDGTYAPKQQVLQVQTISFIARAMVARGWWVAQPDDATLYPNVPAASGARGDLAAYVHYAGPIPGTATATQDWATWDQPATRAWFAQCLWLAVQSVVATP